MSVDELASVGIERMTDEEVDAFLSAQGVGVLGLVTVAGPYLLPLSFGFDGDSRLYFAYLHGELSRKRAVSDQPGRAGFLVYDVDSEGAWQSVRLSGTLRAVPADEWGDAEAALENAWHPPVFEEGRYAADVTLYEFRIEERSGLASGRR